VTQNRLQLLVALAVTGSCVPFGFENQRPNPDYCATACDATCPCPDDLGDMTGAPDLLPAGCVEARECGPTAPLCIDSRCAPCGPMGVSDECARYYVKTPLCGPAGACVECNTQDDCDAQRKTCDTTAHACVPCKANSDCTSGLCNATTGACADKGALLYVNNTPTAACSDAGPCAFAQPCCTVQKGLNASAQAAGKTVIVFAGLGYAEALLASPAQNGGNDFVASAIGVGAPRVKPTGTLVDVSHIGGAAGKQVTLTLDGFTLDASTAANGVQCIGDGASYTKTLLTLVRSTVTSGPTVGVSSSARCTLTLDADTITNHKGGGVSLDASNFALTNLLVAGNGTPTTTPGSGSNFGGISIGGNAGEPGKMNLSNLTIVNNSAKTTAFASGVICSSTPSLLQNTAIFGNQPATEVTAAQCTPSYSAFVGAGANVAHNQELATCAATDLFVAPASGQYQPKKGGTAPCTLVDNGTNAGAPDHDLTGTPRPQPLGGTADIGCYEAR
jgi:hypothetical protein